MQKTQHNFNKFQSFPFGFDFDFSFYSEGFAVEKWALFSHHQSQELKFPWVFALLSANSIMCFWFL